MIVKELIKQLKEVDENKEIKLCPEEESKISKKIDCIHEVDNVVIIYPFD